MVSRRRIKKNVPLEIVLPYTPEGLIYDPVERIWLSGDTPYKGEFIPFSIPSQELNRQNPNELIYREIRLKLNGEGIEYFDGNYSRKLPSKYEGKMHEFLIGSIEKLIKDYNTDEDEVLILQKETVRKTATSIAKNMIHHGKKNSSSKK